MSEQLAKIEGIIKNIDRVIKNINTRKITSSIDRDLLVDYTRHLYEEILKLEAEDTDIPAAKAQQNTVEHIAEDKTPVKNSQAQKETTEEKVTEFSFPRTKAADTKSEKDSTEIQEEDKKPEWKESASDEIFRHLEEIKKSRAKLMEESGSMMSHSRPSPDIPEHEPETPSPKDPETTRKEESKKAHDRAPLFKEEDENDTLNTRFQDDTDTMAEKLKNQPISDLKTGINLNDKIWFINELFEGNAEQFNKVIDRLNEAANYDEAKNILRTEVFIKYDWHDKERSSNKFINTVKRRYL